MSFVKIDSCRESGNKSTNCFECHWKTHILKTRYETYREKRNNNASRSNGITEKQKHPTRKECKRKMNPCRLRSADSRQCVRQRETAKSMNRANAREHQRDPEECVNKKMWPWSEENQKHPNAMRERRKQRSRLRRCTGRNWLRPCLFEDRMIEDATHPWRAWRR